MGGEKAVCEREFISLLYFAIWACNPVLLAGHCILKKKKAFISMSRLRHGDSLATFLGSGQRKLLFSRRHFVYSDVVYSHVFISSPWKPPSCRARRRCMNIQCGEKDRRRQRKETVSSAVRVALAVDKAIPKLVFSFVAPIA